MNDDTKITGKLWAELGRILAISITQVVQILDQKPDVVQQNGDLNLECWKDRLYLN